MKHWLWVPVALATGCFSEPVESEPSGGTDAEGSTGPATSAGVVSNSDGTGITSLGSTGGPEGTEGTDGTGSTGSTDESSETSDDPGSSGTTASGPSCGNGVVEGPEHCDGDDPQGAACLDDCTISCLDQFADCDEIPTGGCEINTATDANNCGACGHVCTSGVCQDSACAPAAIAEGIGPGPTRITRVGDTFVFDESGFGGIFRWDLDQKQAQELVSDDLTGTFRRFAVASGSVVWLDSNNSAAQRVPLGGGSIDFLFAIDDAGSPFASATHLYYPTTTLVDSLQVSTLLEATHADPATTSAIASDVPGTMCQVVETGGHIVWGGTNFAAPVGSVPTDGGPSQTRPVLTTDACNRPMFGVGSFIYLYGQTFEAGPFGLIRHNLVNDASTMIIAEPGFGGLGDYFVSEDGILADVDGEIRVYDLLGGDPVTLADLSENSAGRYLDDQVVMWTEVEDNGWTLLVGDRP